MSSKLALLQEKYSPCLAMIHKDFLSERDVSLVGLRMRALGRVMVLEEVRFLHAHWKNEAMTSESRYFLMIGFSLIRSGFICVP